MVAKLRQVHRVKDSPKRVLGRRDRRKLAIRAALLDATRSLLASRSMDALSIDDIVECADVARGTFYNYFRDKDALERELASRTRAQTEGEIASVNENIKDPVIRMARALCCVQRMAIRSPQNATATMRLFPHATDPKAPINSAASRDIAEAIAQRRIVGVSQEIAFACGMGIFQAATNRILDLPVERVPEFVHGIGVFLLHAFGVRRAEAERIMRDAVKSILDQDATGNADHISTDRHVSDRS